MSCDARSASACCTRTRSLPLLGWCTGGGCNSWPGSTRTAKNDAILSVPCITLERQEYLNDQLKLASGVGLVLLRCKDLNSAGARGIVRVWWETHQTIKCRLIIKSSKCETSASSGRLSIELKQVMVEQIM